MGKSSDKKNSSYYLIHLNWIRTELQTSIFLVLPFKDSMPKMSTQQEISVPLTHKGYTPGVVKAFLPQ